MSRKVHVQLIIAFAAIALILSSASPVQAADSKRVRTVVAKERVGKRVEFASVTSDAIPVNQAQVLFVIKSKKVKRVEQISVTYFCRAEGASPDEAVSKSKYFAPEGGIDLPVKIRMNLPEGSEDCYVSGGLSSPFEDRAGPMTLKLVTFERR